MGARATGEQAQKIPAAICLLGEVLFGSNVRPAPRARDVLEALSRHGVLAFPQGFKAKRRKQEIKEILGGKTDQKA